MNLARTGALKKIIPMTAAVLIVTFVIATWAVTTAFATTTESAVSTVNLSNVTLAANTSYISDSYFGVLHLSVADDTVACASIDSKNHVVVTAVSAGSTTVSFWYKKSVNGNWVSAVMPVAVSGTSGVAKTISVNQVGLVFPQQTVSLNVGSDNTMSGITLNGASVNASTLLWISSSDSVAAVDRDSGKIHAVASGTATVYAIDPLSNSCASVTVIVS
ncbi:hypothetical protein CAFE_33170 [Caprobacter fermentans]|uniref:Pilus assembly protein N-terminal domain-containing protein n=1 Tax=Caproicibacter fermentans TaxID=2576756 RepID=A0A6N8I347_9FIRM|nr:pilus assembly protein N-terminal domain-containing protein [Caproicibacter fermentans]MVB12576.1 hypothetical protein [Caproicibacter fermentans]QNK39147.1 pilus assembly protein N-terminal domain-containing protein [Caproicibacter fermentans]